MAENVLFEEKFGKNIEKVTFRIEDNLSSILTKEIKQFVRGERFYCLDFFYKILIYSGF